MVMAKRVLMLGSSGLGVFGLRGELIQRLKKAYGDEQIKVVDKKR